MPRSLILVDVPLASFIEELFAPDCRSGPWSLLEDGSKESLQEVAGLFLYGHPIIDGPFMDRLPNLKVISNFGVGIDHVDLAAAAAARHCGGEHPRSGRRSHRRHDHGPAAGLCPQRGCR